MTTLKKAAAGFAVAATAAAGITVAGTGAANAAVPVHNIAGNTVNVHVTQPLDGQTCIGMLVPPAAMAAVGGAAIAGGGDILPILSALGDRSDVIELDGLGAFGFNLPATLPGQEGWLTATNVPSNVYALAVVCLGGGAPMEPHIFPAVVGNPLEAAAGSMGGGPAAPTDNGNSGSAGSSGS